MKTKILLKESEMPTHWYNVIADMPNPPTPPLGPDGNPVGPDALAAIFPEELIKQEVSGEHVNAHAGQAIGLTWNRLWLVRFFFKANNSIVFIDLHDTKLPRRFLIDLKRANG